MRVGNASVIIHPGLERDTGHVQMKHGDQYRLRLINHDTRRRVDTVVEVDGKEVGKWRLNPGQEASLERGTSDTGCFTFLRQGTQEASQAGLLQVPDEKLGLVQVLFRYEYLHPHAPAVVKEVEEKTSGGPRPTMFRRGGAGGQSCSAFGDDQPRGWHSKGLAAGGTGLTGSSSQRFHTVDPLPEYDYSLETVITLRLGCEDGAVRPVVSSRGNQVPEALI